MNLYKFYWYKGSSLAFRIQANSFGEAIQKAFHTCYLGGWTNRKFHIVQAPK